MTTIKNLDSLVPFGGETLESERKLLIFLRNNFDSYIQSSKFSDYDGTHKVSKAELLKALDWPQTQDLKTIFDLISKLMQLGFAIPYIDHIKTTTGYRFYNFFISIDWPPEESEFTISFSSFNMINSFIVYVDKIFN